MKKVTLLLVSILALSCNSTSTYFQIYKTESETVKKIDNNSIAFEDDNCRIDYNLWENNGNAGFSFYNKTEQTIYLLLDESFYVINGNAYDYYQNRIFVNTSSSASQQTSSVSYGKIGLFSIANNASKSIINNSTSGIEVIESKVVAVPAKASKTIAEFKINHTVFRNCDMLRFPSSKQSSNKSFTKNESPLKFYNSINYKVGQNGTTFKVKNDFYVSQITNLSEKEAIVSEKNTFCEQKGLTPLKVFKDSTPNKFYIRYTKSQTDIMKY